MFCTLDANGKVLERFDPPKDAWVNGLRYSQKHLASFSDAERTAMGVGAITRADPPAHDKDTHKAVVVKAGPGDDPADAWMLVLLTPEETKSLARIELTTIDLDTVRMIEDVLELLIADGLDPKRLPPAVQNKLARRRALRSML